jgi:hypothetical protein
VQFGDGFFEIVRIPSRDRFGHRLGIGFAAEHADHAVVQTVFHSNEFLDLALHEAAHGDARQ